MKKILILIAFLLGFQGIQAQEKVKPQNGFHRSTPVVETGETVATPKQGQVVRYQKEADGLWYQMDDQGVETLLFDSSTLGSGIVTRELIEVVVPTQVTLSPANTYIDVGSINTDLTGLDGSTIIVQYGAGTTDEITILGGEGYGVRDGGTTTLRGRIINGQVQLQSDNAGTGIAKVWVQQNTVGVSSRVGEWVFAEAGRLPENGYLAAVGVVINGAIDYPVYALKRPELVAANGLDLDFTGFEGVVIRNVGGDANDQRVDGIQDFATNVDGITVLDANPGNRVTNRSFGGSGASYTTEATATRSLSGGAIETRMKNISDQLYAIVDTYHEAGGGGGSGVDTNYATSNSTADGDRDHDWSTFFKEETYTTGGAGETFTDGTDEAYTFTDTGGHETEVTDGTLQSGLGIDAGSATLNSNDGTESSSISAEGEVAKMYSSSGSYKLGSNDINTQPKARSSSQPFINLVLDQSTGDILTIDSSESTNEEKLVNFFDDWTTQHSSVLPIEYGKENGFDYAYFQDVGPVFQSYRSENTSNLPEAGELKYILFRFLMNSTSSTGTIRFGDNVNNTEFRFNYDDEKNYNITSTGTGVPVEIVGDPLKGDYTIQFELALNHFTGLNGIQFFPGYSSTVTSVANSGFAGDLRVVCFDPNHVPQIPSKKAYRSSDPTAYIDGNGDGFEVIEYSDGTYTTIDESRAYITGLTQLPADFIQFTELTPSLPNSQAFPVFFYQDDNTFLVNGQNDVVGSNLQWEIFLRNVPYSDIDNLIAVDNSNNPIAGVTLTIVSQEQLDGTYHHSITTDTSVAAFQPIRVRGDLIGTGGSSNGGTQPSYFEWYSN